MQDGTTYGLHPTGDFSLQLLAMSKQDQSLKAATHHWIPYLVLHNHLEQIVLHGWYFF